MTDTWTPPPTYEVTTPDGRVVPYCLYGVGGGVPVVSFGGAPSIRWERPDVVEAFALAGLRVLTFDRPGYAGATRRPGRSVVDIVEDVTALADAQGWARFAVTGHSCGGPHALACAAVLPDRVIRCAVVAGLAPPDTPDLDFFGADRPGTGDGFTLAAEGESALRPRVAEKAETFLAKPDAAASPGRAFRMRVMLTEGLDGWIDDDLALVRPWGFDVRDITVPVAYWHGTDDPNIPRSHAEWLRANTPGAQAYDYEGGHEPGPGDLWRILDWLADHD